MEDTTRSTLVHFHSRQECGVKLIEGSSFATTSPSLKKSATHLFP